MLREAPEMKYVFIENHRAEFSIKAMCRVLRVARSGWYVWLRRRHQMSLRQQFRLTCDAAVHKAFFEAKQRYGAPRLADELPEFNIKTIAAKPASSGAAGESQPEVQPSQLPCTWPMPVLENLLEQDFSASGPNQKWAGDITYLRTDEGWLYLAVVIDLWSRAVIGWSMSLRMKAQLACDALQMALWRRRRPECQRQ
ncbi:IS3 family transposase [Escherichia coli]